MRKVVVLIALDLLAAAGPPDVATILQRSVEANTRDWQAAPGFDYFERDRTPQGTKTYQVTMMFGSTYQRLIEINGRKLPPDQEAEEQRKYEKTLTGRRAESPAERAKRVAEYRKERDRDHVMIAQLTQAFDFHYAGEQRTGNRRVYVLQANPRASYQPPNNEAKVLTRMRGRLWIDAQTYQWVRVEAEVIQPVSIVGFLARVEPGTRFVLQYSPVTADIWLPARFLMRSRARVLMFSRRDQADETYYGYKRAPRSE